MLTKRQFISIVLMFAALFILFQGPQIARQEWNDYSRNDSSTAAKADTETKGAYSRYAVYIGDTDAGAFDGCSQWALYTKRQLKTYDELSEETVRELTEDGADKPDLVCMDKTVLESGYTRIQKLMQAGINIVLLNLPDAERIADSSQLQSLLGINYVRQTSVHAKGIHLYKGLLLGGERIYQASDDEEEQKLQDLNLDVPWYVTTAGVRTFMSAIVEDKDQPDLKNQDMPALIWRTKQDDAFLYVISGDYMDSPRIAMGILDGILSDAGDYEIYPVVNAQNLVLNGFPALSDENEETMRSVYGYSQTKFEKDIIEPGIWAMIRSADFKPTAMVLPKYDFSDTALPADNSLQYYLRQLREVHGEAGISYAHTGTDDIESVGKSDNSLIAEQSDGYTYGAAYVPAENLDDMQQFLQESVSTVVTQYSEDDPVLSVLNHTCTRQPLLSDAAKHTYSEDLKLLGDESALGYSTVFIDVTRSLWPQSREDRWENLSDDAFSNIATYWKSFDVFSRTTLSESDRKIRRFLSLDYDVDKEDDVLKIRTSGFDTEADYLLRMHDMEVSSMRGGTFEEVEDGVFLLKVTDENAEVAIREVSQK